MRLGILIFAILMLYLWIGAGKPAIVQMLQTAGVL
ncbi:MAG: hypothetical protein JWR07_5463 [Nevskia sp.]|nr:hypothetical protein [Nevskia sp.]